MSDDEWPSLKHLSNEELANYGEKLSKLVAASEAVIKELEARKLR